MWNTSYGTIFPNGLQAAAGSDRRPRRQTRSIFKVAEQGNSPAACSPVVIVKFRDLMITTGETRLMLGYPAHSWLLHPLWIPWKSHSRIGAPSNVLFPETPKTSKLLFTAALRLKNG